MRRLAAALAATLAITTLAATAQAAPSEYGIAQVSASSSLDGAGAHPDFTLAFKLKTEEGSGLLPATTRDISFELPPGLLGNPQAVDQCTAAQLAQTDPEDPGNETGCPQSSQVGISEIEVYKGFGVVSLTEPVFNMVPRHGEPARFGFIGMFFPIVIDTELRPDHGYAAIAKIEGASSLVPLLSASTTLWGAPAHKSHDRQRITAYEALTNGGVPLTPSGERPAGRNPVPFMVNPTRCGVQNGVTVTARSYAELEAQHSALASFDENTGCSSLKFKPDLSIQPTTEAAETGTGLVADLTFPTDGFEHLNLRAGATQRRVEVTLPAGIGVNPSQAEGLGVCTEADFARESAAGAPNEGCPESSKIGSVSARSPLVDEEATGSLYVAKPYQNPFGSLVSIYLVLRIPERGVVVKLPGKVSLDPSTGQLTTVFGEVPYEIPQLPVSSFQLHFREGARSPLVTPSACGTYESTAKFTAWSGQTVTTHPTLKVTSGVNHGPCPAGGLPPFHPGLLAGSINNAAGSYSPFNVRLTRQDGEQEITHFSIKLPPGITGKLAGIPFCPKGAIAQAEGRTGPLGGHEELASPSCPAASEVGRTLVGAGVGQVLTYVPGKVYLAGPYHGSALSIVAVTAGVAGPFDIGTVVVREGLKVNPETAEVFIDATGSDPIPHIINGIPVRLRDIRAYVDKPDFVINPTSCARTSTASTVLGAGLDFVSEADDNPTTVTSPFQAADCASLDFKPQLSLKLKGATKRGGHPALRAVLRPRAGDANTSLASVQLPHSEFLDQGHIRTVCTRAQFKAGAGNGSQCPAGSIYGHARAFSPILSDPLEGPVILRSSEHPLPDLVLAMHGLIDFNAIGRIDSVKGGIRSTFDFVPDAPISKVVLSMQGGKKGLLENSTNLCLAKHRAIAKFSAHNGRRRNFKPLLKAQCKKAKRAAHRRARR